jgi:addiction module HigA family antidote
MDDDVMADANPLIHPGEILWEEFVKPAGLTVDTLAAALHLPCDRLVALVEGRGSVCVDMALRLSHYFGTSDRFWLEMQLCYDLALGRDRRMLIAAEIARPT